MCDDEDTEFLNLAAVCDAIHDFKVAARNHTGIILNSVKCYSVPDNLDEFKVDPENKLINKYMGYDDMNSIIDALILSNYKKNMKIHSTNYTIKLLNIKRNGKIEVKIKNMLSKITEEEVINFLDNTDISLLHDAGGIYTLKLFETLVKRRLNINTIRNREVINDPATAKGLSELEGITQLIDTDNMPVVYNKYSKFNTKYTLTLNKLDRSGTLTDFTIENDGKELYNSSSGYDNTITECMKKLGNRVYRDKKDVIYQVKRSGDWLQALSCLDKRREYNRGVDKVKNITLVTFDRILLVYSLFLGINVFFTCKDGELLYFKSLADDANSDEGSNSEKSSEGSNSENSNKGTNNENSSDKLKYWSGPRISFYNRLSSDQKKLLAVYDIKLPVLVSEMYFKEMRHPSNIVWTFSLFNMQEIYDLYILGFIDKITYDLAIKTKYTAENIRDFKRTIKMRGGNRSKPLCENYIIELKDTIEAFDSGENPDYEYYENVSLIVLACLYEYKDSNDVYEIIQSIVFDILPSIEKKIETKEPDVIQFFEEDKYTADCTSFAARNITLHSLGLRTGSIENLGNREKYDVKINPTAVETFNKMKTSLPPGFEERQDTIMKALNDFYVLSISSKQANNKAKQNISTRKRDRNNKINNNMYGYTKRLREQVAFPTIGGSRKTRRKSRN